MKSLLLLTATGPLLVLTSHESLHDPKLLGALKASGHAPRYVHASSTNSIAYQRRNAWGNLVRPGHAIYGYISPARGKAHEKTHQHKAPKLGGGSEKRALPEHPVAHTTPAPESVHGSSTPK